MAPMGGGGSLGKVAPDRVVSTVDPDARHTRKVTRGAPGRVSGACDGGTGDGDHHRRGADQGRRDGELRSCGGGEVPRRRGRHM
jgi:hypothetical protein